MGLTDALGQADLPFAGSTDSSDSRFSGEFTLGVVTLGLIGGSLVLAAQRRGVRVVAWDRNPVTREAARARGIEVFDSLEDLAGSGVELLVVSSPLVAMADIMARIATSVAPRTTISDAGSVKERVRAAVDAAGLSAQYVGAHPMAGTEKSGFANAFAELFDGATWGVTVREDSEFERVALVVEFITSVMAGSVLITDDLIHDDSVALVSHLPHVLSHALTGVVAGHEQMPLALRLAAGSFRDGTRVARGSAERNSAMITENKRAVRAAVDGAVERLAALQAALAADDDAAIAEFFAAGNAVVAFTPNAESETLELTRDSHWRALLLDRGNQGRVVRASRLDPAARSLEVTYG